MISLEEVRQTAIGHFNTAHNVSYAGTLVNYPNLVVVDLEHQVVPFVSVEINFRNTSQSELGQKEILAQGELVAYFYVRDGEGSAAGLRYADELNELLGMELKGEIYYQAASVLDVVTFPGWKGKMIAFKFDVVRGVDC